MEATPTQGRGDRPRGTPWFRAVPVAPDLSDRLALAWVVDTEVAHDLVPDACVDVLWLPDGRVMVCGPEVQGWTFEVDGPTEAVGVRFRPGHATTVLGTAMDEIRDQQVAAEDLLGPDGRRLTEALDELGSDATAAQRISVLEQHLRHLIAEGDPVDAVADQVAATLIDHPGAAVADLRRDLDLSERQLLRRCTVAFGYGPATLRRILRLQRFLALAGTSHTGTGLADLAAQAGYADQQHLARDARAIARTTPTDLAAERRTSGERVRSVHAAAVTDGEG